MTQSSKVFAACLVLTALATAGIAQQTTTKAEKEKLAKLEKSYKATKAAYTKSPKDAKKKKAYVDATVAYGVATMNSPILESKEKYPTALRLYREALKVDPNNKVAKENAELIVSIYKSLGKPVPK